MLVTTGIAYRGVPVHPTLYVLSSLITTAGEWLDLTPIPDGRTMEALDTRSQDKTGFFGFLRKTLTWMPEDRPTARELLQDPWLMGEED